MKNKNRKELIGKLYSEKIYENYEWYGFYPVVSKGIIIDIEECSFPKYQKNPIVNDNYIDADSADSGEFNTEIKRYAQSYFDEFGTTKLNVEWSETAHQTLNEQFHQNLSWKEIHDAIQASLDEIQASLDKIKLGIR